MEKHLIDMHPFLMKQMSGSGKEQTIYEREKAHFISVSGKLIDTDSTSKSMSFPKVLGVRLLSALGVP